MDPFAVEGINQLDQAGKAIHLADPVEVNAIASVTAAELRQRLGIEGDRQVFLLFGALNGRKGIFQLLEAMPLLSESLCQRICLLFVGESSVAERIETQVAAVCAARPIQVVRHYEFVAEEEVRAYFELADVVLAPYQRHVGMSGIL
ncbi:glycosyltransferase, partial [bacterium]|nr:glycosyltransferase [bacterium]